MGKIVLKNGSSKLYFEFRYNGRQEKTSGLDFSVDNAFKARTLLDEIQSEILAGTFCYSARFPDASLVAKTLHTQQERNTTKKRPDQITIRDFIKGTTDIVGWETEVLPTLEKQQQEAYKSDIDFWLIPLFGNMTFSDFTGHKLHISLSKFTFHGIVGAKRLSGIRVKNILTPLRMIWKSARSQYSWNDLNDPFQYLEDNNVAPKREENPTRALLFGEYEKIREHLDDYNRRIADIKVLTGMIDSEMAGLRKTDIFSSLVKPYLHVRNKIVNGIESEELKTEFRNRKMHITERLNEELQHFLSASPDNYVFTKHDGTSFLGEDFRKAWANAMKAAGIKYERPYCLRHSFAAWSKIIGIELSWLQDMMGHASLEMLFKRYGRHKFGLEDDRESIIKFFGQDYLRIGNASSITYIAKVAKADKRSPKASNKKAA